MTTAPGLRERKKARTRAAIQQAALDLFARQGYDATTVEQIAEAAEVSPSTFFRYFPTKEDVVLTDDYDPLMIAALAGRPRDEPILESLREGLRTVLGEVWRRDRKAIYARTALIYATPALRARMYEQMKAAERFFGDALAERLDRDAEDYDVRVLVAAVTGAMTAALDQWVAGRGRGDFPELLDRALELLASGLTIR